MKRTSTAFNQCSLKVKEFFFVWLEILLIDLIASGLALKMFLLNECQCVTPD